MSSPSPLQATCFRVAALVRARLLRSDVRDDLNYLLNLPKSASYPRVGAVLAGLLALALVAASFGWLGLAIYFIVMIAIFH